MTDASVQIFAVALAATWCGFGLYGLARMAARSPQGREMLERLRRSGPLGEAAALAMLVAVVAIGGTKPEGGNQPRNTPNTRNGDPSVPSACSVVGEPRFGLVEVRTQNVALRAEPTNAFEAAAWRLRGASEDGIWIEREKPFFALGTNPVHRVCASASGALSFESARHPTVGAALPDPAARSESSPHLETALAPFRAPLGILPAANETNAAPSRFWHAPAPGGGLLVAWENVLVDRLPGRRATVQAELKPSGDFACRYDFADALEPPATNLVIGAQAGTNAVNALAILGTNLLAETVWRVDGARVTNGVSVADLLCTNGALRTPARFALEWRNTSGVDPDADADGDGLSDWDEVFLHGTDPHRADTDGDGLSDSAEVLAGADPLDADENDDGVPDGADPAAWAADPLWAANATSGATITISLLHSIPIGQSATLMIGDLSIPLRDPCSWDIVLPSGVLIPYRLFATSSTTVTLDLSATQDRLRSSQGPLRAPASWGPPVWKDGIGGVFEGPSGGGTGNIAVPALSLVWQEGDGTASHENETGVCLHDEISAYFTVEIQPNLSVQLDLDNLTRDEERLILHVPNDGGTYSGTAIFPEDALWSGALSVTVFAHRCDASAPAPFCSLCGHYEPKDSELVVSDSVFTLKHDNQVWFAFAHANSPAVDYEEERIEIRRKGDSSWEPLGAATNLSPWIARIAGTFEVRGRAVARGRPVTTPIAEIEIRFPDIDDIIGDQDVQARALQEWQATLADCTEVPNQRREHAYWIGLDTVSNAYRASEVVYGDWVTPVTNGFTHLEAPPADQPILPSVSDPGALYFVGWIHTHTPTTYGFPTNFGRITGPTPSDFDFARQYGLPGIAYDYEPDPAITWTNAIHMGWPKESPARMYPISPPERRSTP